MIGWIVLTIYVLGFLWTTRFIALRMIEDVAQFELGFRKTMSRQPDKALVGGFDKIMAVAMGVCGGFIWPVVIMIVLFSRSLRSPTEIAHKEHEELEALRKLAKDHGLPMPEVKK